MCAVEQTAARLPCTLHPRRRPAGTAPGRIAHLLPFQENRMNDTLFAPQDTAAAPSAGPDLRHGPGPHVMGAGTLVGNDVVSPAGEALGSIKEIMLDMRTSRVRYAVLSCGGFLSVGEKLFAVPWEALTLDTENKRFVLDVTRERLDSAPGFDKNQWPDMADPTWEKAIHAHYDAIPYSAPPAL
jgi:sporulation protein YlmC with PRC-barrel domain